MIFLIKTWQWKEKFHITLETLMVDQAIVKSPCWIGHFTFFQKCWDQKALVTSAAKVIHQKSRGR